MSNKPTWRRVRFRFDVVLACGCAMREKRTFRMLHGRHRATVQNVEAECPECRVIAPLAKRFVMGT